MLLWVHAEWSGLFCHLRHGDIRAQDADEDYVWVCAPTVVWVCADFCGLWFYKGSLGCLGPMYQPLAILTPEPCHSWGHANLSDLFCYQESWCHLFKGCRRGPSLNLWPYYSHSQGLRLISMDSENTEGQANARVWAATTVLIVVEPMSF